MTQTDVVEGVRNGTLKKDNWLTIKLSILRQEQERLKHKETIGDLLKISEKKLDHQAEQIV